MVAIACFSTCGCAGKAEPDQRADARDDVAESVQCSAAECETSDDCGFCKTICYENCACTWGCIDGNRYAYECDGLANCSCFVNGEPVTTCKGMSASDGRSTCEADNCCGFPSPAP